MGAALPSSAFHWRTRSFPASRRSSPNHFWRPWTAIQNAAAIGHPELQDSSWLSLIPTPPHPEYSANHTVQSGAVVTALKYTYGEDVPPVTLTREAASCTPGFTVTSSHLDDFEALFGLARIYGGIHYRNTIFWDGRRGKRSQRM